ncbi:HMA2 domain-containing protein [Thiorhodococcus minor]|uniref:Cation transporter n=1 Tax=Thiorhodococcus minor TaxID=57489 RepID=A0A6M0JYE8_9GAMM|nr:heavy-metal-associated domain-containing protein [Thiorhodococcus minor]NEV62502.1 cation transporter [Thiorhodococcus minor]
MSHSIHHLPGRLRVRSTAFRCRPAEARAAQTQLLGLEGIRQVRLNGHAGSITVHYDPEQLSHLELLAAMKDLGCPEPARNGTSPAIAGKAGAMFGKALVGAVINKAVERSAFKLVGALL